jgi:hypothetical protein
MIEAGKYYTEAHGQDMVDRHELMLNKMVELGAEQSPPVTIVPMPAGERAEMGRHASRPGRRMGCQLDAQGIPAKAFSQNT